MKALNLLISFCLIFATPVTPALAEQKSSATERYAFLDSLMSRADKMLEFNTNRLNFLEKCFAGLDQPNCETETNKIKNVIRGRYHKLQQHLYTYSMLAVAHHFITLFDEQARAAELNQPIEPMPFRRTGVGAWVNLLHFSESISNAPPTDFTGPEIQAYLSNEQASIQYLDEFGEMQVSHRAYNFSGYLQQLCDEFHEMEKARSKYYEFRRERRAVCDQLVLDYIPETDSYTFKEPRFPQGGKDLKFIYDLVEYAQYGTQPHLELVQKMYFNGVTEFPYVGLVTQHDPSDQELAQVFRGMGENSCVENANLKQNRDEALGNKKVTYECVRAEGMNLDIYTALRTAQETDYVGWVVEKKKIERPIKRRGPRRSSRLPDPDKALEFMNFVRIIDDVVDQPTQDMKLLIRTHNTDFAALSQELASDFFWLGMRKMGKDFALIGVSIGACLLPWYKIPKLAFLGKAMYEARILSKASKARKVRASEFFCIGGSTYFVNGHFLNEAEEEFSKTYRRVFSTEKGENLLVEMNSLSAAEQAMAIEQVFFYTGYVSLGVVSYYGSKLTVGSYRYFKSILSKAP